MQFTDYDLGNLHGGEIVEVTLSGNAANVRLLDSSNLQSYKSGRNHRYYGGHVTRSPVRLPVPHGGHWHVVVDMGGYSGSVRSSVQVLPGALPPLLQPALSTVPSLVQDPDEAPTATEPALHRDYDVFISHATEDKADVVRPLAQALQGEGLKVWFDEFELRIGDSLRRKIDQGLRSSRFGVVVFSKDFFRKGWTNYELDGIVTRVATGDQVLLPIWHNITKQELIEYSPSLADKVARSTALNTVEEIAREIASVIKDRTQ